jgi:hypothetical protein
MSIDRFFRRPTTSDEWRARQKAIEARLEGLTIAELLRGSDKLGESTGHDGYDPNQPRVPAGHPDGGQWTRKGVGRGRINDPRILSDATPDNEWIPGADYAGVAITFFPRLSGDTCRCLQRRERFLIGRYPALWLRKSGANEIRSGYSTPTTRRIENIVTPSMSFFTATLEGTTSGHGE